LLRHKAPIITLTFNLSARWQREGLDYNNIVCRLLITLAC